MKDPAIEFIVLGRPQQKGSKRAFVNQFSGKAQLADANPRAKRWQNAVARAAGDR